MPTYVYRCAKCGETFERIETISEHGLSNTLSVAATRSRMLGDGFTPSSAGSRA